MLKETISETIQNKNVLMFVTAIFFMSGILAFFNNCILQISAIVTVFLILLVLKKYVSYKYILLWGMIFYLGFFNAALRIKSSDGLVELAPEQGTVVGQIVSIPNSNVREKTKFFFEVEKFNDKSIKGKTLVSLQSQDGDFSNLNIGNTYKISGKLRRPFKASNPSQFDYGHYLRNFKTYTVFYAENIDCVKVDRKLSPKWRFMQELNNTRNRIITAHSKYLKSPYLEILGGIVFGDDAVAPPDYVKDSFKNSGLLHILAASGMNVAFIYGFWYFILRRLRVPFKLIVVSGMGVVILYTLMTGLGASVIRAALMLLFVLAGKLIDRDSHSVSLLSFVAALMLIYNPAFINDVGFQLSFIVTFGLLTTANAVMKYIHEWKIPDWLCAEILIPIVAQIWVAPIQMFYFNSFSTYSVFANISIMPFLSVISFGGFVSSVLAIFNPIADFVCMVSDFVLKYFLIVLVWLSNFFSNLPYSLLTTTHPSVLQIIIFYIAILAITLMFKSGFSKRKIIVSCACLLVLIISVIPIRNDNLEVIAFDVQNADAFLIKTPKNKYFIIDTGKAAYNGGSSQAKVIILKYLKDRGIKNIEGLIITHFDNDHCGGVVDLINNLKIKNVYINSMVADSYTSKHIFEVFKKKNISPILAKNNEKIYSENSLTIKTYRAFLKSDNENSIMTLISYNNFDELFMGDAGIEAYGIVKNKIPATKIEVLKVGHHGANGVVSNEMLNTLKPDVSIVSTGQNKFGHPTKVTLDTLRNTDIYRTDKHNSVKISVNSKNYGVYTYNTVAHKYELFKKYNY